MLTADLLRVTVRKGVVKPTYLKGKNAKAQQYAESLCALYSHSAGWSRSELQDELREIVGDSPDFLLARGLAKLLDDRCTWTSEAVTSPEALRAALYDAAFARTELREGALKRQRPAREDVIAKVATAFDIEPSDVDISMFADLRDAEVLQEFQPIEPDALLRNYDVALAQATLLRASEVTLTLRQAKPGELRALLNALKFHQLLFQPSRNADGDWVLQIDGPTAILQRSSRYGLQLAMLVPVLLHLEGWSLEATLRWPNRAEDLTFVLSDRDALMPTRPLRGAWKSAEQQLLEDRISEHKSGWRVDSRPRLIPLGARELFAPEITLIHPDGRRAYVEIVGTWRRHWLRTRLDVLKKFGPPNTVLCVSRNMAAEKEALSEFAGEIVDFAQVIPLPRLLAAVEAVASSDEEFPDVLGGERD